MGHLETVFEVAKIFLLCGIKQKDGKPGKSLASFTIRCTPSWTPGLPARVVNRAVYAGRQWHLRLEHRRKKSVSRGTGGGEAVETHVQHVTRRHCVLPAL
jgi:hypothetical protein